MLGIYCLGGKADFIMTNQGNDVGFWDFVYLYTLFGVCMFNAINVFTFKNVQVLFYCVI